MISKQDFILKKNSLSFVPVSFQHRVTPVKIVCVEPGPHISPNTETISAVYNYQEAGRVAVINYGQENVYLPANTTIGYYSECLTRPVSPDNVSDGGNINKLSSKPSEREIKQIISDLKLSEKEKLRDPKKRKQVEDLVREFADIFSTPDNVTGKTDLIEFDIDLKPDAKPSKAKLRPLNPNQLADLKRQIKEWEDQGVVSKSDVHSTSWTSALNPVLKKDGNIRWTIDYRALNAATVSDRYPLPSIEENLEKLQGSDTYTLLDSKNAYWTVGVKKSVRPYLTFICQLGSYHWNRMAFGLKNAASTYSRFVQMALSKLDPRTTMAYLDDIITHTVGFTSHLKHLRAVFQAHREAGLRLRADKSNLFEAEIDYLGFHVSKDGISMLPKYKEKVLDWPTPRNVKELNSFLGFSSYYRSFLPTYSFLTNEMNNMKKAERFEWTSVMEEKFQKIKKAFREAPIRAFPRYDGKEPFQVAVDFSKTNIGGILTQKQDGVERLIQAAGRKTTPYESNYSSYKGEAAAVVFCCRRWEHILLYDKFILHTDQRALVWLRSSSFPRGILARWIQELACYDFVIQHRPGRLNRMPDSISRSEHPDHLPPPSRSEVEEESEYVNKMLQYIDRRQNLSDFYTDDDGEIITLTNAETTELLDMTPATMKEEQEKDPILCEVRSWVAAGTKPTKQQLQGSDELLRAYAQNYDHLRIHDGLLYQVKKVDKLSNNPLLRLVVPESKWASAFHYGHLDSTAAHPGQQATVLKVISKMWWPGVAGYLKSQVSVCDSCLAKQTKPHSKTHMPHKPVHRGFPTEQINVDLVGPISPPSRTGCKYILTVEDSFSRYVVARPIPNKEGETVVNQLFDCWISMFGVPAAIHSDNGREFANSIFNQLSEKMKFKITRTPAYNPQSNPVERFHRSLNQLLRVMMDREDSDWSRYIPAVCLAHNTRVHSSTGLTPHHVFTGREAKLPVDLVIPSPESGDQTLNQHVQSMLLNIRRMYEYVRKNQDAVIRRNSRLYSGDTSGFIVGAPVWYLAPLTSAVGKKPLKISDSWVAHILL